VASNGLDFDGVDDYVSISNGYAATNEVTYEAWVYTQFNSNFQSILDHNNWNTGAIHFQFSGSTLQFDVNGADNNSCTFSFSQNTWYHLAVAYSKTGGYIKFYVNGTLTNTINKGSMPTIAGSQAISMGAWAGGRFFKGIMDEVRIWNVARSIEQIQANMNSELLGTEAGLVAYYPFNQGIAAGNNTAITTVTDKTANAINGTLTNFAKTGATSNFVVGKVESSLISSGLVFNLDASNTASYAGSGTTWKDIIGNNNGNLFGPTFSSTVNSLPNPSLYFNGNGQYVDFGASPANFPTGDISVSVWIYFSALSNVSWNIFMTKWFNGSGSDFHYSVKYNGTSYKQNLYTTGNSDLYGTTVISPNSWYCLGFTIKNGGDLQFYVNGVPDGKYTTVSRTNGNSIFYLGDFRSGTGLCFNGYLSGANLYNRTLTSAEMLNNYNAVKGKFGL
jgi:hypothetical protein